MKCTSITIVSMYLTTADSIHRYLEDMDRFNTKWNRTAENTLITITCTGEYTGTVSRNCSSAGMWNEPDYIRCISKSINNLKQQVNYILQTINSLFVQNV